MEWELEVGTVGRGDSPRLRGPGWGLEQETAWLGEERWEAAVYLGEMRTLAHSTLACVMDYF